ncbi:universal stress protein [Pseudomaricurvus sp. HS19]|uniref:universal stress protein n=1 Tax=Pseudomaricurvus sp. HS19 TaxID=2692626 RepID=UPI00136B1A0E|nr:universal stress protein [Pseudomaricurvus sp. HS19]MYM62765.1 universal stress protein [Pseudomaricurvus sp. HS19]
MANPDTLFIVVDPTQDEHIALQRALITSRRREVKPKLKIFVGVDPAATSMDADNPDIYRDNHWFEALRRPLDEQQLDYTLVICWSTDWYEAILQAAEKTDPDMILLSDYSAQRSRNRLTDNKWQLMRHAKCPVVICRPGVPSKREVVLAAVKMQDRSPEYEDLNTRILTRGKWLAEHYDADFQVVNAYSDSLSYPDRGNMMRSIGIEADKLHILQGPADEVVSKLAEEISADIVVIGTLRRKGLLMAMRGNTSERVMSALKVDVMTLN